MAAITLKDLMDPLTKIERAAEQTNEKLDMLIAVSTGGSNGGGQMAIIDELQTQTMLLQEIAANTRDEAQYSSRNLANFMFTRAHRKELLKTLRAQNSAGGAGGGGGDANAEGNATLLKALGVSSMKTAMGMLLWAIVPKKGVDKFTDFIERTFTKLAEQDNKKVSEGIDNLNFMGNAIFNFAKKLALATPLLIIGALGIPVLYLTTLLVTPLFLILGMGEKKIESGANALESMGAALLKFSGGLAVFALVTALIMMGGPALFLGMAASIVLVGGAVALLGLVEKQVDKGSGALAVMGLALGVFGLGYMVFALTVAATAPTMEAIGLQFLILGGMGIVFALAGLVFSQILQGALSFATIGLGLLVFGIGYNPFAKAVEGITMEDVGVQMALLTGIGLVMAAAGALVTLTAGAILLGPVMYAAVGGALLVLAPGLEAIKKVNFTEDDSLKLATMLAGVKTAFIGPPNEGGVSGFFKSIGGAISGAVDSVKMIAAAAGFAAAGVALSKLSVGLKDYQKLDWTNEDSLRLTGVLSGITTAFAQAGGEAATPTGLFGAVFGNAFSPNATKKGINSVMGAGKALTSIAEGLTAFSKLVEADVDFDYIGKQIELTVGFIQRAFAAVAEEGNVEAGGFFNSLFGIKKNKVKEGLDSVKGAGKSLNDIANGLTAFQALVEKNVDFDKVGKAISKSVGFVQEAFSAVAEEGNVQAGGFWNSLFKIKKNKVQEGVKSVKGAGAELKQIADGLSTFAGIEDPQAVANKVKLTLGLVGDAFASIGGKKEEKSAFFGLISWNQNKIEAGIDAVDGAGQALTDIAAGLKAFSGDFQPEAVAASVGKLLTSIGTAFSDLYESNPYISEELEDFSSFIVTLGDVAEKGQLDKAADGISKIADSINKIDVDKAITFGNLFDSANSLSSDRSNYRALARAVEDIRDILAEPADTGGGGVVGAIKDKVFGKSESKSSSSGTDKTLRKLNASIDALPSKIQTAISSIELEVKPAGSV